MTNPPAVITRILNWGALVRQREGEDWNKPDPAYQFSNNRVFESTDKTDSGIYED